LSPLRRGNARRCPALAGGHYGSGPQTDHRSLFTHSFNLRTRQYPCAYLIRDEEHRTRPSVRCVRVPRVCATRNSRGSRRAGLSVSSVVLASRLPYATKLTTPRPVR
jgi:hypothetical protein